MEKNSFMDSNKAQTAWRGWLVSGILLLYTTGYAAVTTYRACTQDVPDSHSLTTRECLHKANPHIILLLTSGGLALMAGEILSRLVALPTCIGDRRRRLCDACLPHGGVSGVVVVALAAGVFYTCCTNWTGVLSLWQQSGHVFVTWVFLHAALYNMLGLKSPSKNEMQAIQEQNKLNVANGLAWSYYMGFLRIILPGLKQRILESDWYAERKCGARMPVRMYLLLPESCRPPQQLSDVDEHMTYEGVLKQMCVSRAGFVKRPYNNSVYSFTDSRTGQLTYCAVESSASLLTVHELTEIPEAGLSATDKHRQMELFYHTLADILQRDPNGHLVRLVPYKDVDSDGQPVQISEILSSVISEDDTSSSLSNGSLI